MTSLERSANQGRSFWAEFMTCNVITDQSFCCYEHDPKYVSN